MHDITGFALIKPCRICSKTRRIVIEATQISR
jgi:hypothetical protein